MKHSFNSEILNAKKLLNSDFINRLTGFAEEYDKFRNLNTLVSIEEWIHNEDYSNIRYFLFTSNVEYLINFSIDEFVSMSPDDFYYYHEFFSKLAALLDEKKSLYEEFISFYE